MAKKRNRGELKKGLSRDQIARATTTAGDVEFASDLAAENNPLQKKEKAKEQK